MLVFDLDGTLTPSKATMPEPMAHILSRVLERYDACVISGGAFHRFEKQLLPALSAARSAELQRLHLMPTCGTQRYEYDASAGQWRCVSIEQLSPEEKAEITTVLQAAIHHFGYDAELAYGPLVEDRDSQITYSALGQDIADVLGEEGLRRKAEWDPDDLKKRQLQTYLEPRLPNHEVRIASPTSLDVTRPGMDKAYGVRKLMELLGEPKDAMLFFGDRLQPGGNDYPVHQLGIDCVEVRSWEDTARSLETIVEAVRE